MSTEAVTERPFLYFRTFTAKRDLLTVRRNLYEPRALFVFWPTKNMARAFVFVLALSLTPAVQPALTVPNGGYSRSQAENLAGRKCAHRVPRCLRLFSSFCAVILL